MNLTIFIPTAGIGSRLGDITKSYNKSLLPYKNKPLISHIIDSFPKSSKFVIALGHKSDQVRQFLDLVYPHKKISYVYINNYIGKGSGLGLTLLKSKKFLQKPFLFCPCDGLFENLKIDKKVNNIFFKHDFNDSNYRYIETEKKKLSIKEKKKTKTKVKLYTGIAYIKDYEEFWKYANIKNPLFIKSGESYLIDKILKDNKNFVVKKINWKDFGNKKLFNQYSKFSEKSDQRILHKDNETIYFVGNKIVKYNKDENFIKDRVRRSKLLFPYVPKIIGSTKNFYIYNKIEGKIFSDIISKKNLENLLYFCVKFWTIKKLSGKRKLFFKKNCNFFYKEKTFKRVKNYLSKNSIYDNYTLINNLKVDKIFSILKKIPWQFLSNGIPTRFHGDLHFENILKTKKNFKFLDWRQNFYKEKKIGDIYYDLAKIMHGIYISHKEVYEENFKIKNTIKTAHVSIKRNKKLILAEKIFKKWIVDNGYDLKKVMILTSLIYLNICSLHHFPYNNFLFLFGKKMLVENLKEI